MVYDLSPGDVIHIGDALTLTVVAGEGNVIRFGLDLPDGKGPVVGPESQKADPKESWWELN